VEIAEALGIDATSRVLDIGSGLGGAARALAGMRGCTVVGVDLTPAFCEAAAELSRWTRLDGLTSFRVGEMARNQVTNLADRRIRTVTFACRR
jgi:cyclopropane fatty-acyl-phospholipid synthase-like methyltransferase